MTIMKKFNIFVWLLLVGRAVKILGTQNENWCQILLFESLTKIFSFISWRKLMVLGLKWSLWDLFVKYNNMKINMYIENKHINVENTNSIEVKEKLPLKNFPLMKDICKIFTFISDMNRLLFNEMYWAFKVNHPMFNANKAGTTSDLIVVNNL